MKSETFDAIVIGAGQGGGPLSSAFASAGMKTALIEREFPGGTCVNWGCTPTKTLIASGRVAYLARRAADYGVATGDFSVDMSVVKRRGNDIVASFRSGSQSGIDNTEGLEYIEGDASFTGHKAIEVKLNSGGTRRLVAETIVINVGERARTLSIDTPDDVSLLDNRSIMQMDVVPEHLMVVGGGPIALEFAQLFRRLGAEVTILNRGKRILSREDADIAESVAEILTEDGLHIIPNAEPTAITRKGSHLLVEHSGEGDSIQASHILVASGRVPNTDSLSAQESGIEISDKGFIPTNSRLETNVPGVFAIGDVRPGPKFTHISYDDYRILKSNLIDGGDRTIDDRILAHTTYIDPQLGRVGATERELRDAGTPYLVAKMPMSRVARALETDESRGLMKILIHAETERILGAAILGVEGGEIASMIQIAMMGDLPFTALRDGVFAHPTLAESLNNVLADPKSPE